MSKEWFWATLCGLIPVSFWMHQFEGIPKTSPGRCGDCWRVRLWIWAHAHWYGATEREFPK